MIREPAWVPEDVLHLLHDRQVELFGGIFGVRDPGVVQSALYRPRFKWQFDPDADLSDLAAAHLCGLVRQQGFLDGNKRTAVAVTLAFLDVNGVVLDVPDRHLFWITIAAAKERMGEAEVAAWLRRRLDPALAEQLPPIGVRKSVLTMERVIHRLSRPKPRDPDPPKP